MLGGFVFFDGWVVRLLSVLNIFLMQYFVCFMFDGVFLCFALVEVGILSDLLTCETRLGVLFWWA